jgi:regulation of enolase protein 1 (concanavalin A-like superfamily)
VLEADGDDLYVEVDGDTNYWQRTRHGRRDDNGHFLWLTVSDNFEMSVAVSTDPNTQYDQAGLMVRTSEACWMKTSAEFERPGRSRLGAVVTNHGWSDWSTQDVAHGDHRLRVRRAGGDVVVHAAVGSNPWSQLRVAHLTDVVEDVRVGVYACSPRGPGFTVHFRSFYIATHITADDLS